MHNILAIHSEGAWQQAIKNALSPYTYMKLSDGFVCENTTDYLMACDIHHSATESLLVQTADTKPKET